jgi:8-oxo-dGTP pyrophosphatase MutT (NUDIX family)
MPMKYSWETFLNEEKESEVGMVACLNDEQQFLILRRSDLDDRAGQWTMPGGHIDPEDVSIEAGALRELREEANLTCKISDLTYLGSPKEKKYYFLTLKWSGDVNVDKPNPKTDEIEHDDYKWSTIKEIKDIDDTNIPIYLLEKALEIQKEGEE